MPVLKRSSLVAPTHGRRNLGIVAGTLRNGSESASRLVFPALGLSHAIPAARGTAVRRNVEVTFNRFLRNTAGAFFLGWDSECGRAVFDALATRITLLQCKAVDAFLLRMGRCRPGLSFSESICPKTLSLTTLLVDPILLDCLAQCKPKRCLGQWLRLLR